MLPSPRSLSLFISPVVSRSFIELKENKEAREVEEKVWRFKKMVAGEYAQWSILKVARALANWHQESFCEYSCTSSTISPTIRDEGRGSSSHAAVEVANCAAVDDSASLHEHIASPLESQMTQFQKVCQRKARVRNQVSAIDWNKAGLSDGEDEFFQYLFFFRHAKHQVILKDW